MTIPESCEKILQEIQENIPENHGFIRDYLIDQTNRFSSHQCQKEITKAISSLAIQSLSTEEFQQYISHLIQPEPIIQAVLDAATFFLQEKKFQKTETYLDYILPYANGNPKEKEDVAFVSFRDFIEYAYYAMYLNPESELPVYPYLGTEILFVLGKICAGKEKRSRAFAIFTYLARVSPVNDEILFEIAELYRNKGELEDYRKITNRCFTYAWRPEELAHAYRNMGYYFTESRDYEIAITCYLMGTTWEESPVTAREISYITEISGITPDISDLISHGHELLEKNDVPFSPNPEMTDLMIQYAKECKDEGDFFEARKYLSRAKALQLSDDLEQQITSIERFMEDSFIF